MRLFKSLHQLVKPIVEHAQDTLFDLERKTPLEGIHNIQTRLKDTIQSPHIPAPFQWIEQALFQNANADSGQVGASPNIQYRLALAISKAVAIIGREQAFVYEGAKRHDQKLICVRTTLLNQPLELHWRVDQQQILQAIEESGQLDQTDPSKQKPSHLTLTIAPEAFHQASQLPFNLQLVMQSVHIEGETALAEWLNHMAAHLRPDFWSMLAEIIGDIPTHLVERGHQSALAALPQLKEKMTQEIQFQLNHAQKLTVSHQDLDQHNDHIIDQRLRIDRLSKKIEALKTTITQSF